MNFIRRMSSRTQLVQQRPSPLTCKQLLVFEAMKPIAVNIELNQNKWKWICFSSFSVLFNRVSLFNLPAFDARYKLSSI